MATNSILPPYPLFHDDEGNALEAGYIYIGTANLDPVTNPISVYWDVALTVPVSQPIRTVAGYPENPSNPGDPAIFYVGSNYSIEVQNRNQVEVYSAASDTTFYTGGLGSVSSYTELRALTGMGTGTLVRVSSGTGIDGLFRYDSTQSATDNGGTIIAGWVRKYFGPINVKWFGAKGDGATDDTAAIQAAIDYAKSFSSTQTELEVVYPAGAYVVTTLDYVGANRTIHRATGAVIFYGVSVGGTSIIDIDGGTTDGVNVTRNIQFLGNFSVQIGSGGSYQYGVYISNMTNSRFSLMGISGAYSVNNLYINFSFDNPLLEFIASNSSGTAIATVECGTNNVNRNNFVMRTTGDSDLSVASVGMIVRGNANRVSGDFSSSQTGVEDSAGRGNVYGPCYFEANKYLVALTNASLGAVFTGGLWEVGQDGIAIRSVNSDNATFTGGYVKGVGGATNRTFVDYGTATYSLDVSGMYVDSSTIDTSYTGTKRGDGGNTKSHKSLSANWITFAATTQPTTQANTLDDYEEGSFTPAANGITFAAATGYYTKFGNTVVVGWQVTFPATADGSAAQITNMPFSADGSYSEINGTGFGYNTSSTEIGGAQASTVLAFKKTGAGGGGATNANMTGATVSGTTTFFTTS